MLTTMTINGQVTIPKKIRDALDLKPDAKLNITVNRDGDVVLQRTESKNKRKPDRFEDVRGTADIKWRTKDLMALLRGGS
jgi:antitoxin PrlF